MVAVNCLLLIKVVGRALSFQRTTLFGVKAMPCAVNTKVAGSSTSDSDGLIACNVNGAGPLSTRIFDVNGDSVRLPITGF